MTVSDPLTGKSFGRLSTLEPGSTKVISVGYNVLTVQKPPRALALALSPPGRYLFSACEDALRLWDLKDRSCKKACKTVAPVSCVDASLNSSGKTQGVSGDLSGSVLLLTVTYSTFATGPDKKVFKNKHCFFILLGNQSY